MSPSTVDRCPHCGATEISYGGDHMACCGGCGLIADEEAFEVSIEEIVTDEMVADFADGAREGGSNYWCDGPFCLLPPDRSLTYFGSTLVAGATYPSAVPASVQELEAEDPTKEFPDAVDALDAALGLSRPGAARLLVVVSDGRFIVGQRTHGHERVTRLLRSGCAVLWLGLDGRTRPLEFVQTVSLASPADVADAIGRAAVRPRMKSRGARALART